MGLESGKPGANAPKPGDNLRIPRSGAVVGTAKTGLALLAGQAATGLALLVLARRSEPASLGIFAALYTSSLSVGGLLDFGSSQLWTRELSRGLRVHHFRPWMIRRTLAQVPMAGLFVLSAWELTPARLSHVTVFALALQAATYPFAQGALAAVRGLRSAALATWLVAAGNVVTLLAAMVAPTSTIFEAVAIASSLSWLLTAFLALWLTRTLTKYTSEQWVGNPWRGSVHFGVFSAVLLAQGFTGVLIAALAGGIEAGNLAAIAQWTQPVYLLAAAYATHMFPILSAASSNAVAYRLLRPVWLIAAVGAAVSLLIFVLAPQLVHMFLGAKYEDSIPLLRLSALAATPVLLGQPLAGFLQARGGERFVAITTAVGVPLVLLAIVLLARTVGASVGPLTSGALSLSLAAVFFARTRRLGAETPEAST